MNQTLILGDCIERMREMDEGSVDAIVTDPPYGLRFMGRKWDYDVPSLDVWKEALRVAKPGAHLLSFGGSRTYHRMACAIEDAGWEIRDCIMWVYGSGFPKSMDVSKAIDAHLKHGKSGSRFIRDIQESRPGEGRVGASLPVNGILAEKKNEGHIVNNNPSTPEAARWNGYGTCLKPAFEPIIMARKPLDGTVADNVLKHGVGGINIDGCRVPVNPDDDVFAKNPHTRSKGTDSYATNCYGKYKAMERDYDPSVGRFPANLIHDGSDEVLACFPANVKGGTWQHTDKARHFNNNGEKTNCICTGKDMSVGSAARFFYCAKASRSERGERNTHPTVKPLALMKYLVTLVAPPGSVVMDPFMGSGTTGVACAETGHGFIGIEREPVYYKIAGERMAKRPKGGQMELFD